MEGSAHFLAGLPGSWEIWIILLIVLLLFGRRIPQVARSLGQGISQFKRGLNEPDPEPEGDAKKDQPPKEPAPATTSSDDDDAS